MTTLDVARPPDRVYVFHEDQPHAAERAHQHGQRWTTRHAEVATLARDGTLGIAVHCGKQPIARLALRWTGGVRGESLILGDAWERSYGDLQWRTVQPERVLPWYFAVHDRAAGRTFAAGVKTQPNAFCSWTIDDAGITLWLDLRNGGLPALLGDRVLHVATVVQKMGDEPMTTIAALCRAMCERPRLAPRPICGNNNWYYAYGRNFDHAQVLRDATLLAELADGHANEPYCVIDAGWSPGGACPGGPWTAGKTDIFPDMIRLAEEVRATGVRPGIWMRPTALSFIDDPKRLRPGPQNSAEKALDLTLPENMQLIRDDVARLRSWGYELIKHDFSTWDMLGRWGHEMGANPVAPDWHWADRSRTNAEIMLDLYRTLRDAAGDAILLGCNTMGHLGAGLFEVQRTGDDTSGKNWERTRKMGVNTLAFRLPQQGTFFAVDADCCAHTALTPWDKDRQWLDLVARSGTALFVSIDPTLITAEQKAVCRDAMRLALSGGCREAQPFDWLTSTTPSQWRFDDEDVSYDWIEDVGAWPQFTM